MGETASQSTKTTDTKSEKSTASASKGEAPKSTDSPVEQILHLQRTVGNRAVQRLVNSGAIRAKLKIGQPGDIYEREADRVAEQVMRMPEVPVQRQPIEEEEEELVQTKAEPGQKTEASGNLEGTINSARSGGRPLSQSECAFFEPRFGQDFSDVKVHTGTRAAESARAINAKAYTVGQDVVFGAGQYSPGTTGGQRLIGHELTHVVQQGNKNPMVQRSVESDLIDGHTSWWRNLNEERLGSTLFKKAKNREYQLVLKVLDELGSSDRDDVSYEFLKVTSDEDLAIFASIEAGACMLDRIYDEIVSGNLSLEESKQSRRILKAQAILSLAPEELEIEVEKEKIIPSKPPRSLNKRELELVDFLIMDFDGFEETLKEEIKTSGTENRLIRPFLEKTVREIRKITDALPSGGANLPILARIVRLYWRYINLIRGGAPIMNLIQNNSLLNEMYRAFRKKLERASSIVGIKEEIEQQVKEEKEAKGREQRREEAAKWVPEIIVYPERPTTSRITVGEDQHPWHVYKIHRERGVYAVNINTLETARFTTQQWFDQRGWTQLAESFSWLRVLEKNVVIQFLAGLIEGVGKGIVDLVSAIVHLDKTLTAISKALGDLYETGRAIKKALLDWIDRFAKGGAPERARMIGKLIGGLIFEAVLTKGIGKITMVNRALKALKTGSVGAVRSALSGLRKGAGRAGMAMVKGIKGALALLQRTGMLRRASNILRRSIEVGRGTLNVAGRMFSGVLHVTEKAYHFLFDKARNWTARIGARIDEWAWEGRSGVKLSAMGVGSLDDAVAVAWRKIRRPHWRQSEKFVADYLGKDWKPQVPFYGEKMAKPRQFGRVIPDYFNWEKNIAAEVKNWDILRSYDKLITNLIDQAGGRIAYVRKISGHKWVRQWLFLDVRGQKIGDLKKLAMRIQRDTGGPSVFEKIHFITESGVQIF